ncbi:hypothetical protein [Siphonobacter sp. SORGH_AS_0500]|uniref:hypothetical protein n=1 Tax=Siphonobacter sp. SORGH_AS_0500 TaxID=1864824 RepID=UPI00286225EA|nr:hypothetical protein [Siphonobacter sp. SORGH_AS_0500]MDR6195165.1 hypothetical protein [Siphonobacter sp. SORGH_AS_0500]
MAIPEEILKDLTPILEDVIQDGVESFKRALEEKGLVLTEELKQNFSYQMTESATELTGTISFYGYGRFKDMSRLNYLKVGPPVDDLEEYVQKVGVERFAFVPGYKKGKIPTVNKAAIRIAFALSAYRKKVKVVYRPYKGTWYNSTKVNIVNIARRKVTERYSELITKFMADLLETTA